jgi:CTP:molybdopterin cytidylyltransferase MocA
MPPTISALLLAAGSSTRMGQPKALLPLKDQPTLRRCLGTLLHGMVWEIIVILGPETEAAAALLEGMPLKIINNTLPQSDMAKSVRLGLAAMKPQSAGALVFPVDHPLVQPETLKKLVAKALEAPDRIIIPTFQERRGHPTLFPKAWLAEIYQGFNLREIIGRHPDKVTLLPVEDEGVVLDMDTPEDYREICRRLEEETHE